MMRIEQLERFKNEMLKKPFWLFCVGFLCLGLLISQVLIPLWVGNQALKKSILDKGVEVKRWEAVKLQWAGSRPLPRSKRLTGSLFSRVQKGLEPFQKYHPRIEAPEDKSVRIAFDEVPFDLLINWLQALPRSDLKLGDFSFVRKKEGYVSAQLAFVSG